MGIPEHRGPVIILISPIVSQQMGGEGILAWQIYEELVRRGLPVVQVTHSRVRAELSAKLPGMAVEYVEDDWLHRALWRSVVFRPLLNVLFMWQAAAVAARLAREHPGSVVHVTTPVSPVAPTFRVPNARVVIGPLNGNIYYPPAFRARESLALRVRRLLHPLSQRVIGRLFPGKRTADALLVSGGERTTRSLAWAGCSPGRLVRTLTSGVTDRTAAKPRVEHRGSNFRFVHYGRLVPHKGVDLAIRAVRETKHPVELDVIGRGPDLPRLRALADSLGVADRVRFIEWFPSHEELLDSLHRYRGFVFPSLAEAHGIVVQEAMVLGLPVVCLDWGGPSLLVRPEWGVAVPPRGEGEVAADLAAAMDLLGADGVRAEAMSRAGREAALSGGFLWSQLMDGWLKVYGFPEGVEADSPRDACPVPTGSGNAGVGARGVGS